MNKRDAKKMVEAGVITYGFLKDLIGGGNKTGMSVVNKALTKQQVADILLAPIADIEDDKPIELYRRTVGRPTKHNLIAQNILREFG